MISDKPSVQFLHKFCKDLKIKNWIFSPGSRNAPITLTIGNDSFFNNQVVVDERSAGFVALGLALKTLNPSVLCCTSGSASLNYAPALSEAFYQGVSLLVITADRPQKWVGNGEGQSINQINVYQNYCKSSYHIEEDMTFQELEEMFRKIEQDLFHGVPGPVHLNMAFEEPLYNTISESIELPTWVRKSNDKIVENSSEEIVTKLDSFNKVLVLCGQMIADDRVAYLLSEINKDSRVVVMTETLSNLSNFHYVNCIDRTLERIQYSDPKFHPELVITIGEAIVSKKIKKYLREIPTLIHWSVDPYGRSVDVFQKLEKIIKMETHLFFRQWTHQLPPNTQEDFKNLWIQESFLAKEKHEAFLSKTEWSDLKVFELLLHTLPENTTLHMGNSSPVRYVQLFEPIQSVNYQSNRGVSGIDGCVSTALGYSLEDENLNVLIVGDLSFGYDSNAFWNRLCRSSIKVIVINNQGGGIFRIIPGPETTHVLDQFFEVGNSLRIQKLCEAHEVAYFSAHNSQQLESALSQFYDASNDSSGCVLEIFTPNILNAEILKNYFNSLKE